MTSLRFAKCSDPHLVDDEHERGVNTLDIGLEVLVERGDVLLSRDDAEAVSQSRRLVGEAVVAHVAPERLSRHFNLELIGHEAHQDAHRDGLVGGDFRVNEVFDQRETFT